MAGTVIVPWYATGFRADAFETALNEVAATALRYGAGSYAVYRARDSPASRSTSTGSVTGTATR